MSDKMIAGLDNDGMRVLDAAAWIADNNLNGRIDLIRHGDELQVVGTDCYVLVSSLVSCQFDSWPDGECVSLSNFYREAGAIRKLLKRVEKYTSQTVVLTVEDDGADGRILQVETIDTIDVSWSCFSMKVRFKLLPARRIDLGKFEDMIDCQPEGHVSMSESTLEMIGKLVKKVSGYGSIWTFNDRGPLHAFDIRRNDGKTYIIAMPVRTE